MSLPTLGTRCERCRVWTADLESHQCDPRDIEWQMRWSYGALRDTQERANLYESGLALSQIVLPHLTLLFSWTENL